MNAVVSYAEPMKIGQLADEDVREHYVAQIAPLVRKTAGNTVQALLDLREMLMSREGVILDIGELIEAVADILKRNAPDWAAAESVESRSVALHSHARANSLKTAEQSTRGMAIAFDPAHDAEEPTPF